MALSPISRSAAPSISAPTSSVRAEPAIPSLQGHPKKDAGLQSLFQQDGFEAPGGIKGAEGLQKLVKMLASQVQMLGELAQALSGEGGPGKAGEAVVPGRVGGVRGPSEGVDRAGGLQDLARVGGVRNPSGVSDLGGVPDLGGEGFPAQQVASALPPEATPAARTAPVDANQKVANPQGAKKDGNTLTLNNDGDKPMKVQFTPNAGDKAVDSVTLQPGESQTVKFPDGWSGNFRSSSGDGKNATLGEVKFNGGHGQTYYDVSYIEGHNAAMTMQPESGGRKSGTMDNLLASAPDAVKARGEDGSAYGIKKSTTSNVQDSEVVDFFRKHVGADQGYVIPTDDASTLGSGDSNLVVHMKNLT